MPGCPPTGPSWSAWSSCSKTCGTGGVRVRFLYQGASEGGAGSSAPAGCPPPPPPPPIANQTVQQQKEACSGLPESCEDPFLEGLKVACEIAGPALEIGGTVVGFVPIVGDIIAIFLEALNQALNPLCDSLVPETDDVAAYKKLIGDAVNHNNLDRNRRILYGLRDQVELLQDLAKVMDSESEAFIAAARGIQQNLATFRYAFMDEDVKTGLLVFQKFATLELIITKILQDNTQAVESKYWGRVLASNHKRYREFLLYALEHLAQEDPDGGFASTVAARRMKIYEDFAGLIKMLDLPPPSYEPVLSGDLVSLKARNSFWPGFPTESDMLDVLVHQGKCPKNDSASLAKCPAEVFRIYSDASAGSGIRFCDKVVFQSMKTFETASPYHLSNYWDWNIHHFAGIRLNQPLKTPAGMACVPNGFCGWYPLTSSTRPVATCEATNPQRYQNGHYSGAICKDLIFTVESSAGKACGAAVADRDRVRLRLQASDDAGPPCYAAPGAFHSDFLTLKARCNATRSSEEEFQLFGKVNRPFGQFARPAFFPGE